MFDKLKINFDSKPLEGSAPCRIDMGGTLDIGTFYFPLRHLRPCTFNVAVDLRTRVRIFPNTRGRIKISSKGFKSAEFAIDQAPFDHPLGLMFAVAAYFRAEGVHIEIESSSPPKSALGGSSAAAVALVALFYWISEQAGESPFSRSQVAMLAHGLEASVAGVPCGLQDQLAAVYGGVNAWHWPGKAEEPVFRREPIWSEAAYDELGRHILLAYCGIPHESKNINSIWVKQFISGKSRKIWEDIVSCTKRFIDAIKMKNFSEAASAMNQEMALRKKMTPEVLDAVGEKLISTAVEAKCGARITGAGGGGCVWAVGEVQDILKLKPEWKRVLEKQKHAGLLDVKVDSKGVICGEKGVPNS